MYKCIYKYAIISIVSLNMPNMPSIRKKVVKMFNLWLVSLSQLYIFMQIIFFSGSIRAVIYYTSHTIYMQSIAKGVLLHQHSNTTHIPLLNAFNPCLLFQSIHLLCKLFFWYMYFWCVDYITHTHIHSARFERWTIWFFFLFWSSLANGKCFLQNVTS